MLHVITEILPSLQLRLAARDQQQVPACGKALRQGCALQTHVHEVVVIVLVIVMNMIIMIMIIKITMAIIMIIMIMIIIIIMINDLATKEMERAMTRDNIHTNDR